MGNKRGNRGGISEIKETGEMEKGGTDRVSRKISYKRSWKSNGIFESH